VKRLHRPLTVPSAHAQVWRAKARSRAHLARVAILASNVVNIVLFHAVLAPGGLAVALFVFALGLFTAWSYRDAFALLLRSRTAPRASTEAPTLTPHTAS
jgi:hypothetical protein